MKFKYTTLLTMCLATMLAISCASSDSEETEGEGIDNDTLTGMLLLIALTPDPQVKIVNASGGSEYYALRTYPCGTIVHTFGTTADGSETALQSVGAGRYSVQYNSGGSCVNGPFTFSKGRTHTCTSGTSLITCN